MPEGYIGLYARRRRRKILYFLFLIIIVFSSLYFFYYPSLNTNVTENDLSNTNDFEIQNQSDIIQFPLLLLVGL